MADYSYINNYTKNGSLAISRRVFETIAVIATNKINGAEVSKANKNSKDFWYYF